ncbi:MAG: Flp family type IVb pilin [Rhodoblastus sp.]|nr:Flp family type IVb pilin [Rhodoblastus sp.]
MTAAIIKFVRCRSGASAVEYALLAMAMAVAIVAAAKLVGTALNVVLSNIANNAS